MGETPNEDATSWSWPIDIEWNGQRYTQLTVREPTGAEWSMWAKLSGIDAQFMALATVSGIPEPAVRQIGVRTITQAGKFLDRFFA